MESWLDNMPSCNGDFMRARSRLNRRSYSTSAAASRVSFLEESRVWDNDLVTIRDLEFTSRRLELAQQFQSLMRSSGEHTVESDLGTSDNRTFPRGDDELRKNFRAVQEENFKLQAVITDVTEVNKRWQKYNNDRQMYVQRLLSTIQDQQEQMNKIAENKAFPAKECESVKPSVEVLIVENCQLQEEVSRMKRRVEDLEQEHHEHVEVLEFQVKAHRDDWEAERSEKQQAIRDKATAEAKARELQKDLRTLKLKLREDKVQGKFHCCGTHTLEAEHCNIYMPGSQVNMCRKGHPKTYRTSGHLLSRGTTLFFGDDLAFDGEEVIETNTANLIELPDVTPKPVLSLKENLPLNCPAQRIDNIQEVSESHPSAHNPRQRMICHDYTSAAVSQGDHNMLVDKLSVVSGRNENNFDGFEFVGRRPSEASCTEMQGKHSAIGLEHDDRPLNHSCSKVSSVLHITPSGSGSSIEPDVLSSDTVSDAESMSAGRVTVGFSSNGLASVTAFAHVPIVKSSSLPVPEENRKKVEAGKGNANPLVSRWSLDSNWSISSIASPPVLQNFAASADSLTVERKYNKFTTASTFGSGSASGRMAASGARTTPQSDMYFDEGVATQTREDVICPGCGKVFPPKQHLKFLDHFEKCQSNDEEQKRSSNTSAVKSRN